MNKNESKTSAGLLPKAILVGVVGGLSSLGIFNYIKTTPKHKFQIIRVIDGDTIDVEAPFLPVELKQKLSVRVHGVDTPEKGALSKCELERQKARQAKQFVENEIKKAKDIKVVFKEWDKYGGRVLGDFEIDGKLLSKKLIDNGHAVAYDGGKKTKDWCTK